MERELFSTPITVDVERVSEKLQMELLDLQCDSIFKEKHIKAGVLEFYKFLPSEKYLVV